MINFDCSENDQEKIKLILDRFSFQKENNNDIKSLAYSGTLLPQLETLVFGLGYQYRYVYCSYFEKYYCPDLTKFNRKLPIENYYYSYIFSRLDRQSHLKVLNIGIKNNVLDVWSRYLPNSEIYGCDSNHNLLVDDRLGRIKTCYIEQLEMHTYKNIEKEFGKIKYDLIIVNGLQNFTANLNGLLFGLDCLNDNGFIVVENIDKIVNWYTIDYIIKMCRNMRVYTIVNKENKEENVYTYSVQKRIIEID